MFLFKKAASSPCRTLPHHFSKLWYQAYGGHTIEATPGVRRAAATQTKGAHPLRGIYHTCQNQERDHAWLMNLVLRTDVGCCEECKPSGVECDGRQQRTSMGLPEDILGKNTVSRILVKMSLGLKNVHQQAEPLMDSTWTDSAEATVPRKPTLTIPACSGWTVQRIGVKDLSRYSLSWPQHAFREKYAVRCWPRRKKSDLLSVQR